MVNAFVDPSLRIVLFVFMTIIMGLTGSLINGSAWQNPQVNFAIFVSAFGMLFGAFYGLLAGFVEFLAFPIILAFIDFCDFVFCLSGGAALAHGIRVHSCTNHEYLDNNRIVQGSTDRCRKAQATTAFLFFSMAVAAGQLALSIITMLQSGPFSQPSRKRSSPPRTGLPTMSQV
ncbi:uncharacterized protein SAPINGB_P001612 [Magnusiomyces paraingens]|uniref:MARVEL domain-containing protein n=1 Tax=Magnusiomyces paraingens TaxID=2606893 RepID=A0A5E8B6M3_9ASCO|nr:uncharacterized protein SAPINGB_P001612 [Saprochaete ingens]VVT47239.1 unnamed protein product [Saprochaete ingens]